MTPSAWTSLRHQALFPRLHTSCHGCPTITTLASSHTPHQPPEGLTDNISSFLSHPRWNVCPLYPVHTSVMLTLRVQGRLGPVTPHALSAAPCSTQRALNKCVLACWLTEEWVCGPSQCQVEPGSKRASSFPGTLPAKAGSSVTVSGALGVAVVAAALLLLSWCSSYYSGIVLLNLGSLSSIRFTWMAFTKYRCPGPSPGRLTRTLGLELRHRHAWFQAPQEMPAQPGLTALCAFRSLLSDRRGLLFGVEGQESRWPTTLPMWGNEMPRTPQWVLSRVKRKFGSDVFPPLGSTRRDDQHDFPGGFVSL